MRASDFSRWMYRGGRPNRFARILNRASAIVFAWGIAPDYLVTLEVTGHRSGRRISFPLVMVKVDGLRYLVSMLGENAAWLRNIRAADGKAVLRHGRREEVRLEEIPAGQRAPILKAYLQRAPGARPHVVVDRDAPLLEFERIAATIPVFRVLAVRS
jgi:deazaflavin-dependent oxidoreductase (nitroreductase family)